MFDFYGDYQQRTLTAPGMCILITQVVTLIHFTVKSYKGILALAKIAQKSCDASTRTVGRDVQNLFPSTMKEEVPYFEEQPAGGLDYHDIH